MQSVSRAAKLEQYAQAYSLLSAALVKFPREMWHFRPSTDSWTIHEIIIHIADSEVNSYVRCRRLVAEPGSPVLGYDETRWASQLNYAAQNPEDALALFQLLRKLSYELIEKQPEDVWNHTIHHSENGLMSMDDWLDVYTRHIPDHVAQMESIYQIWAAR